MTWADRIPEWSGGRYAVRRPLGDARVGEVFEVFDATRNADVLLTVIRVPDDLVQRRFVAEVRLASILDHPGIQPLYDLGTWEGRVWFTGPLLEGETLRERLRRSGKLDPLEAFQLTRDMALALDHAFSKHLVHRDLMPDVVYLVNGRPVIAGFGVVHVLAASYSGMPVGNPRYMSPDVLQGTPIDVRGDLFSLGNLLYEMLTGSLPTDGATSAMQIIMKIMSEPPAPPSAKRSELTPVMDGIVLKLLAKDPADRYQSGADLAAACDRIVAELRG